MVQAIHGLTMIRAIRLARCVDKRGSTDSWTALTAVESKAVCGWCCSVLVGAARACYGGTDRLPRVSGGHPMAYLAAQIIRHHRFAVKAQAWFSGGAWLGPFHDPSTNTPPARGSRSWA
jgi:hypothetical protein